MKLYPLSIEVLQAGMHLDFGIYGYVEDKLVLLCNDILLTESMLQHLRKILIDSPNIYAGEEERNNILHQTEYFAKAQEELDIQLGYTHLRSSVKDLLEDAEKYGSVSREAVSSISSHILHTLATAKKHLIIQCINSVREVDEYLYTHCVNVGILNGLLGQWMGYDETSVERLVRAGFVHDLGKLKMPPEILNKPGNLTSQEFSVIKGHPHSGYEMLLQSGEEDFGILQTVLQHHEKCNGTGYPLGLHGDEISIFARITSVSDVYDAMVNKRVYKAARSPFEILEEMQMVYHSHLDRKCTQTFLQNMPLELVGKQVLLSDGSVALVEYVDFNALRYPLVSVDGQRFKTNSTLYCVRMYSETTDNPLPVLE